MTQHRTDVACIATAKTQDPAQPLKRTAQHCDLLAVVVHFRATFTKLRLQLLSFCNRGG